MSGTARLPRRTVLKGAAVLGIGAGVALPAAIPDAAARDVRFIIDARLPEAPALSARAARDRHGVVDPAGEMIALLLGNADRLLARGGYLIGLTGYADFALAQDLLRGIGRPVLHAIAIDGSGRRPIIAAPSPRTAAALDALLGRDDTTHRHRATSFAWMA